MSASDQNQLDFSARKKQGAGPVETLEGALDRVTFVNEENGWSVVRLRVEGQRGLVTAVGVMPGVREGETLRLTGRWVNDRKFGQQFRVESCLPVTPSTLKGIEKYLGSGMVPGVGPEMARRLVEAFGVETLDVIERQPDRLLGVEGIGPKRRDQIVRAWADQRAIKDVMLFLQTHGVTPGYAMKIVRRYGDSAVEVVKENPYRLARDIRGIGFKIADKIAAALGIEKDAPQRAEAGVLHTLGELADSGHVFAPLDDLVRAAEGMLEIDTDVVESAVRRMTVTGDVVLEHRDDAESDAVYAAELYAAERGAAEELARVRLGKSLVRQIDVEAALDWFEKSHEIELAPRQREAVRQALRSKLTVITGGPGTGKTTLVNAIIQVLGKKGVRITLCAPTGRAARRLQEASGHEARTIHRLLEFSPRTAQFERGPDRPLEADLVVVDEVSMVDTALLFYLARALPDTAQLVLVGDIDQLPSVGPGSVLREVIQSEAAEVVALDEIFRQAASSRIVVNAHRINRGEMPLGEAEDGTSDFYFIERDEPDEVLETIKELVSERIPRRFDCDPFRDVQVLTPMHRGVLGATNLNEQLQALLNPRGKTIARGNRSYRVGDKVMQIRNNYDLDVFNGDLGRIVAFDEEERKIVVRFEQDVTYDLADLDELVPAYACSIHKSQGSEYPVVVVPVHTQHYVMLQRNLLYTAITRGRNLVILVGSKRALSLCVKNNREQLRHTRLGARLRRLVQG